MLSVKYPGLMGFLSGQLSMHWASCYWIYTEAVSCLDFGIDEHFLRLTKLLVYVETET